MTTPKHRSAAGSESDDPTSASDHDHASHTSADQVRLGDDVLGFQVDTVSNSVNDSFLPQQANHQPLDPIQLAHFVNALFDQQLAENPSLSDQLTSRPGLINLVCRTGNQVVHAGWTEAGNALEALQLGVRDANAVISQLGPPADLELIDLCFPTTARRVDLSDAQQRRWLFEGVPLGTVGLRISFSGAPDKYRLVAPKAIAQMGQPHQNWLAAFCDEIGLPKATVEQGSVLVETFQAESYTVYRPQRVSRVEKRDRAPATPLNSAEELESLFNRLIHDPSGTVIPPGQNLGEEGILHCCWRSQGTVRRRNEFPAADVNMSLANEVRQAKDALGLEIWQSIDTVELCISNESKPVDLTDARQRKSAFAPIHRGVYGWEIRHRAEPQLGQRLTPQQFASSNRSLEKWIEQFCSAHDLPLDETYHEQIQLRWYSVQQFLIHLRHPSDQHCTAVPILHGARTIDVSEIDRASIIELEKLQSEYLVNSVHDDGRMTYLYYPSRGSEDKSRNNQIRQWMATLALARVLKQEPAIRFSRDEIAARLRSNIQYNLDTFASIDDQGLGRIDDQGKVKLGAVALAALALRESPAELQSPEMQQALFRTIDHLAQDDGSFRTFLVPRNRNDNQNFYSGEALLAWSDLVVSQRPYDPTDLESLVPRFMRAVEYYRHWHLSNRNPAFVPWHTQACFRVWQQTQDAMLRDWIFEMNDWLLAVQQWEDAPYPDCRGRFYDPHRPFGPPHASSTGVYLEGLADAFQLAGAADDSVRAGNYREAIHRGLRSLDQLTFKDETDMFYVTRRERLRGGVRTTVANNVVRVDNVQHGLMAIQKILRIPGILPGD